MKWKFLHRCDVYRELVPNFTSELGPRSRVDRWACCSMPGWNTPIFSVESQRQAPAGTQVEEAGNLFKYRQDGLLAVSNGPSLFPHPHPNKRVKQLNQQ